MDQPVHTSAEVEETVVVKQPRRTVVKTPHPLDDLEKVLPVLDAKLKEMNPRQLGKLRRIARLEREATGEESW